jgi:glycosyltransferase involved in cell wall biosynthesis
MVDILLATHNSEKYLAQLLDSLLTQMYRDIRILVSDDASQDGTIVILRKYIKAYANIVPLENEMPLGGAKQNFFWLTEHSTSEYAMFADHDDMWLPNKVADTLALMQEAETKYGKDTPILAHTDLEVVDADLKTIAPSMMHAQRLNGEIVQLNRLLVQNHVTGCTSMVNRALLGRLKYGSLEPIIMHDWWLALVASAFGRIVFLNKPTVKYRQHAGNEIGAVNTRSAGYVRRNLADIGYLQEKIKDTYMQAAAFYDTYWPDLSPQNEEIVRTYADFIHSNKLRKWGGMLKYNLFKNGFIRKCGQLILG